jgi:Mrp family chromosome partitioning ATPase
MDHLETEIETIPANTGKELQAGTALELTEQAAHWTRPAGSVLENMRLMVARIHKNQAFPKRQKGQSFPKRVSVFSALSGEGVTSVCLALGATLAGDYGARVCLVDLNWYSPSSMFQYDARLPGIADILKKQATIETVLRPIGNNGLFFLPAGQMDPNERPVAARSKALRDLLLALDERFDHLVLDIPAILSTSDAISLAGNGNGCCLVIQQGVTPMPDIKMALVEVSHLPLLGVIINRVDLKTPNPIIKLMAE